MKFGEANSTSLREVAVELPCSGVTLTLTVKPLPCGLQERIRREIPAPRPPSRQAMDRRGRPCLVYDERDPEYERQCMDAMVEQAIVTLRYALAEDKTIAWDKPLDRRMPLKQLAEETKKEMDEIEFPVSDLLALVKAVTQASGITTEMVEGAASDFSPAATPSSPGRRPSRSTGA